MEEFIMSKFKAFLKENAEVTNTVKYAASKRFKDENGNPVEWEIRPLSSAEAEDLKKECTRRVKMPGKHGMRWSSETDTDLYVTKLAVASTVYPDLYDAELQNSYGVMKAEELLQEMLLPGEYADYLFEVQDINGFDIDMDELVDEVKN